MTHLFFVNIPNIVIREYIYPILVVCIPLWIKVISKNIQHKSSHTYFSACAMSKSQETAFLIYNVETNYNDHTFSCVSKDDRVIEYISLTVSRLYNC